MDIAEWVPFVRPFSAAGEIDAVAEVINSGELSGPGLWSERSEKILQEQVGSHQALLTTSCTSALELAALILGIGPGDEVIMPSFTFVSTANAFALRGAKPVFVDIDRETFNIDEKAVERAITARTAAIVVVHYAGVPGNMDVLKEISNSNGIPLVEDAAQALGSTYKDQPLGSFGDLATFSFHKTKNISCGEGGALMINRLDLVEKAYIARDKGTNRRNFDAGYADKYEWKALGSSFAMAEVLAAQLHTQLEHAHHVLELRMSLWEYYYGQLEPLSRDGKFQIPAAARALGHNAHIFWLLLPSQVERENFISFMKSKRIDTPFHYVPLHTSSFGKSLLAAQVSLPVTEDISSRLVRLPLWPGMNDSIERVVNAVFEWAGEEGDCVQELRL